MLCVTSKNLARFQLSELWPERSRSLQMLLICSAEVKEHLWHKSAYFTVKTGLTQAYCRPKRIHKRNDKNFSLC